MKKHSGFTLIELLVVIAIIGLLATIVMVSLNSARAKTRDVRRIADLKQITTALDLYYDKHGAYFSAGSELFLTGSDALSTALKNDGFISTISGDPKNAGGGWGRDYGYFGGGAHYSLRAALETTNYAKTSNYPDGSTCVTAGLPTCPWSGQNCVYEGYNSITCGRTYHLSK